MSRYRVVMIIVIVAIVTTVAIFASRRKPEEQSSLPQTSLVDATLVLHEPVGDASASWPRFNPHREPHIASDPEDDPPSHHLRRQAQNDLDVEDYTSARREAQACLTLDPSDRDCFMYELWTYTRTGDFTTARTLLDECLFDEPNDVECLGGMVTQDVRAKDFVSARARANRIRELAPDSPTLVLADAQIADQMGDREAAIKLYDSACHEGQEYACTRAEALRASSDGG